MSKEDSNKRRGQKYNHPLCSSVGASCKSISSGATSYDDDNYFTANSTQASEIYPNPHILSNVEDNNRHIRPKKSVDKPLDTNTGERRVSAPRDIQSKITKPKLSYEATPSYGPNQNYYAYPETQQPLSYSPYSPMQGTPNDGYYPNQVLPTQAPIYLSGLLAFHETNQYLPVFSPIQAANPTASYAQPNMAFVNPIMQPELKPNRIDEIKSEHRRASAMSSPRSSIQSTPDSTYNHTLGQSNKKKSTTNTINEALRTVMDEESWLKCEPYDKHPTTKQASPRQSLNYANNNQFKRHSVSPRISLENERRAQEPYKTHRIEIKSNVEAEKKLSNSVASPVRVNQLTQAIAHSTPHAPKASLDTLYVDVNKAEKSTASQTSPYLFQVDSPLQEKEFSTIATQTSPRPSDDSPVSIKKSIMEGERRFSTKGDDSVPRPKKSLPLTVKTVEGEVVKKKVSIQQPHASDVIIQGKKSVGTAEDRLKKLATMVRNKEVETKEKREPSGSLFEHRLSSSDRIQCSQFKKQSTHNEVTKMSLTDEAHRQHMSDSIKALIGIKKSEPNLAVKNEPNPNSPNTQRRNLKVRPSASHTSTQREKPKVVNVIEIKPNSQNEHNTHDLDGKIVFTKKPAERCLIGLDINLKANYFALHLNDPQIMIRIYNVVIKSTYVNKQNETVETLIKSKDVAKELFKAYIAEHEKNKNLIFFDFNRTLYCYDRLKPPYEITKELSDKKKYIFKTEDMGFVTYNLANIDLRRELQCMLTHNFHLKCLSQNRSFFPDNFERIRIGINTYLYKGFYSSVKNTEEGFSLNMDVANSVFSHEKNLLKLATEFYQCNNNNNLKNMIQHDNLPFLNCIGKKLRTYLNQHKQPVGFVNSANTEIIDHVEYGKLTIADYFKRKRKINLEYPNLPCLKMSDNSVLPLELLCTEFKSIKKVPPALTTQIIQNTAVRCNNRRFEIEKIIRNCGFDVDPILKQFNINLSFNMIDIGGKVLAPPDIQYLHCKLDSNVIGRKGQWDTNNKKFLKTACLDKWAIVDFGSKAHNSDIGLFFHNFQTKAEQHNINIRYEPVFYDCKSDMRSIRKDACNNDLEMEMMVYDIFNGIMKDNNYQIRIIFVIVDSASSRLYSYVKTYGDVQTGIRTQVIDENTILKANRNQSSRLLTNILLKVNVKLGGTNFKLSEENELFDTHLKHLFDSQLMIFGADVNHPSITSVDFKSKKESIAALVGSIDKECCYYPGRLLLQKRRKGQSLEPIYGLARMVTSLLEAYHEANKILPKRLLFLRDGVSDTQFNAVLSSELSQIRQGCKSFEKSYNPTITFVIIQKRHHTRLFPVNVQDECGIGKNVPPGTLVDRKIITPDMFDFFLCSHSAMQGTSRPCHYYVLHDENNFTMNEMTLLCYYLCHIFARSASSVSYPAPLYYAHLLAERGRLYTTRPEIVIPEDTPDETVTIRHFNVNERLKNRMFYI